MPPVRKFVAASVPRYLRQTKLGYLPLDCVIGSHSVVNASGARLVYDVIMLPVKEFMRMRANIGLRHAATPKLELDGVFQPAFVLADRHTVTVPAGHKEPQAFARDYFIRHFRLPAPARWRPAAGFRQTAKELQRRRRALG